MIKKENLGYFERKQKILRKRIIVNPTKDKLKVAVIDELLEKTKWKIWKYSPDDLAFISIGIGSWFFIPVSDPIISAGRNIGNL